MNVLHNPDFAKVKDMVDEMINDDNKDLVVTYIQQYVDLPHSLGRMLGSRMLVESAHINKTEIGKKHYYI